MLLSLLKLVWTELKVLSLSVQVVATLRGRQLPGALQQYIWLDVMYYWERKKDGASQV